MNTTKNILKILFIAGLGLSINVFLLKIINYLSSNYCYNRQFAPLYITFIIINIFGLILCLSKFKNKIFKISFLIIFCVTILIWLSFSYAHLENLTYFLFEPYPYRNSCLGT